MRRLPEEPWLEDGEPLAAPRVGTGRPRSLEARLEAEGERRFLFAPVCVGCGILSFFGLRHDPSFAWVALAALLAAGGVWRLRPGSPSRHLAGAILFFLCGMAAAILRTASVDAPVIAEDLGPLTVTGRVERIEEDPAAGDRITLLVSGMEGLPAGATPRLVTVRSRIAGAGYEIGAAVRVRAVLLPPPDAARPGGFDYARQAFFAGIGATGYAISRPEAAAKVRRGLAASAALFVERLRGEIGVRIRAAMSPVAGAIATALVTGQRSYIPDVAEEELRAAGLAHILAISGLHMMLVVGTIFAGARYGAALLPEIALTRPVKKWAAALALAGGTAYLAISGWSVATQRAYIMAAVLLVAVLADRPAITMRNVALAALVILLLRPEAAVTAGFQMSFAATTALVAAYEALRGRAPVRPGGFAASRGPWRRLARYAGGLLLTSFVAGAATAPFAAYHFGRVAAYGLVGNLLAMPVFGFLVMPTALLGTILMPFGLEAPFLWAMGQEIDAILAVAGSVAGWPGATRMVPAFQPAAIALIGLGALWLGLWRTGWRRLGLAGIFAGFALAATVRPPDLYIGRGGRMVATAQGATVTFLGRGGSDYEREQWLAGWGLPPDHPAAGPACDRLACYHAGGPLAVSLIRDPAAFADDCALSHLVVAAPAPPSWCAGTALVVSREDLAATGTVAGRLERGPGGGPSLRLATASGETGARAWNWRWRAHGPPPLPALWPAPQ